jgi:5'-methylthioinosine phosphorylase
MLAIIGGTGFGTFAALKNIEVEPVESVYGSTYLERADLAGVPVLFLPRHGRPAQFPPHKINYRANIQALSDLGVTKIIAVTAVGSVDPVLEAGDIVIPDQIIDYTAERVFTFYDDEIHHIDFTYPYSEYLRQQLIVATGEFAHIGTGVYGCTQGPRLETAAEIKRLQKDGCTIVGMTAMPEAALARERNIDYAGISLIVNKGAGIDDQAVDMSAITQVSEQGMSKVGLIILSFVTATAAAD